jgi:membrane protein implicated in regulation of membrane protease activity
MFESSSAELLWFLLGLGLVLAELALPGFVIIFFGVGAWITAFCVWVGFVDELSGQLLVFLVSSVASLVLFRKHGKNYFQGKVSGKVDDVSRLDEVRGERAMVVEEIVPNSLSGKVEFRGTVWNADSDTTISKGTPVEVVERTNLTLKVKPISQRAS